MLQTSKKVVYAAGTVTILALAAAGALWAISVFRHAKYWDVPVPRRRANLPKPVRHSPFSGHISWDGAVH